MTAKPIPADELRDAGYLQEANRQFFHPLGLALTIDINAGTRPRTTRHLRRRSHIMNTVTELIERAEARASRIDEKVIAREYATVTEADAAAQWAIDLRTIASLLRDYIQDVPL